ncbi:MAG TPA: GDP-mannose 4,6-dehydratase [Nitrospiria bacterium]|jgi:UDP-glucuronate 4-epimerase
MNRVLVTGGAGFIGSHLMERLLGKGLEVVCLDNFDPFYDPNLKRINLKNLLDQSTFTLVEGDIRDLTLLKRLFEEFSFDLVFHGAARAGVRPSLIEPLVYEEVNVRGTLNLLEMAKQFQIKNFVFASSSSVYGSRSEVPFSEKDRVDYPISPYAATKKAGELLCYTYYHLYKIPMACLRFFTVYGPRQRPEMAIHKFTRLIHEGKPIPLYGGGKSRRDYTYIDDAIDGVVRALDRKSGFEVLNIGESQTVTLFEMVRKIESLLGKKAQIEFLPEQPGDVPLTYADVKRAGEVLGYFPRTSFEDGMKGFIQWFLEMDRSKTNSEL